MNKLALILFAAGFAMACNSEKTVNTKEEIVQTPSALNTDDKAAIMQKIDTKVAAIKAINTADLTVKEHQLMGGGRTFFVDAAGNLVKIKGGMLGAAMTLETVFYLDGENLIFVEELMTDYNQRFDENSTEAYKESATVYFDKNLVIDYKSDAKTALTEEEIKEKGEKIYNNFQVFVNEYKSL